MTIKQHGGVFGRNPSFNNASVETLSIAGTALSSTAAELNILDGVTADATELNYLDGASTSAVVASKAVLADASGNIAFPDGNGIDFSATGDNGTTTPDELFDDYEEGTWTPTYVGSTADPTSVNYTSLNAGTYVKAGRQVTVQCTLGVTTFTAGTGDFRIGGLPFAAASSPRHNVGSAVVRFVDWDSSTYEYLVCYIHEDENVIRLYQCGDDTDFVAVPVTAWSSGGTSKYVATTITYFV